ncbi:MAG: hypothetical protein H8E55_21555 [Pelagibacterales bacterium]|nr:hypothetical protein [Pelagibacterales bacterium]
MKKIRKGRNPRYQTALDLAQTNNNLLKKQIDHNFNNVVDLAAIKVDVQTLTNNTVARNERLTDAYIKLSSRYWSMLNRLEAREARLDLVTRQLRNYVPDHWLFEEESAGDAEEDNSSEPEPDPQMGFNFGEEFKITKH